MKKTFTISAIVMIALSFTGAFKVYSQIAGFDATKYYMIINRNSKHAIGIDDQNYMLEGALIQQQEINDLFPRRLWKIVPLSENTYHIINKGTDMALGVATWRGDNPFWNGSRDGVTAEQKDLQLTVPSFIWSGSHRGICQQPPDATDETQIWNPTQFPTGSTSGDTTFYRMTLNMNLADSGFCFNVWERRILLGYRNICLFPGTVEAALYDDATSLYAYYFVKTNQEVITDIEDIQSREIVNVYSLDGNIFIEGNILNKRIEVYTILGTRVYSDIATSTELYIPLHKGIYIVRTGKTAKKVVLQ